MNSNDITNPQIEIMILLYNGQFVPKCFYDGVKQQVEDIIEWMKPENKLTLKELCDEAYWNQLSKAEASLAGKCMVDMVRKKIFPLTSVGCAHANPKKYQLK